MSKFLSSADFERLRGEKESRRADLFRLIESARAELGDIEEFLARLTLTEQYLTLVSCDGEFEASRAGGEGNFPSEASLPDMIAQVLNMDLFRSVSGEKPRGLKPSEIALEINRLFGELADRRSVNAHVWYLYSKGRVKKKGMRYYLAQAALAPTITDPIPLDVSGGSKQDVLSEADEDGLGRGKKEIAAE